MNGLLIIDKPAGITSHDVVSRVRRALGTKRVGHTGTLDPFATGVVVTLVGPATRLAQFLDKDEKEYIATIRFGTETDTGDLTGAETGPKFESAEARRILDATDWAPVLAEFTGDIKQVPPMYSAKKVAGKRLYELARKGETIERAAVRVRIGDLSLVEPDEEHCEVVIRVTCSAGTYIRTLAEDIGRRVGVGAHLTELRRTRAGRFGLTDAITLEDLSVLEDASARLLPMHLAVEHLPAFTLPADRVTKTMNGMSTRCPNQGFGAGKFIRMMGPSGELLAIGQYDESENSVRPKVVLV